MTFSLVTGRYFLPVLVLTVVLVLMTALEALAGEGNCSHCHVLDKSIGREQKLSWPGPLGWWKLTACPPLLEIKWQMYLTESRLYRLEAAIGSGQDEVDPEYAVRLQGLANRYRKLLKQDLVSADVFAGGAVSIRREMNSGVFRSIADRERRVGLIFFLVALLVALLSGTAFYFIQIQSLKRKKISALYLQNPAVENMVDRNGAE